MQTLAVILTTIFAFIEILEVVSGNTLGIRLSVPPLEPYQALNFIQNHQMPNIYSHRPYHTLSVRPQPTNFGLHEASNSKYLPTRNEADFQSLNPSRPASIERKILSKYSEFKYQNTKEYHEDNTQYSIFSTNSVVESYTTTSFLY